MSEQATSIGKLEFDSPINLERSCTPMLETLSDNTHSTMELFYYKDNTGFIEWDIPELEMTESIGLVFEITPDGKRILTEYDGVFCLPDQAMDLLEKHGVDCADMRKAMAD